MLNEYQQPVGPPISWEPIPTISHTKTLRGKYTILEPISINHAPKLYENIIKSPKSLFTYMTFGPFDNYEQFYNHILKLVNSKDPLFFAILNLKTLEPIGMISLMRIDLKNGVIEVGSVLYTNLLQKDIKATECQYLLMNYIFEDLGFKRYEWKCDSLNQPSRNAAIRLGFSFEGIFRNHMIYRNRERDTAWFSIIDKEWSKIKKSFEIWLNDDNFNNESQILSLKEIRDSI